MRWKNFILLVLVCVKVIQARVSIDFWQKTECLFCGNDRSKMVLESSEDGNTKAVVGERRRTCSASVLGRRRGSQGSFFSSICWLRMEWKRERSRDAQNEFIYYIYQLCIVENKIHRWWVQWLSFQCAPMHNLLLFCLLTQCTITFPLSLSFFRGREKTGAKRDVKAIEFRKPQFFVMISARKWKKNSARASCEGWPL